MNERDVFQGALDYSDPAQRQAYLDQACGNDTALRARIEALLLSHESANQFLKVPAVEQFHPIAVRRPLQTADFSSGEPGGLAGADDLVDDGFEVESRAAPDLSFLTPSSQPGSLGTLGHYEILQLLGEGAFGLVFKAFDEKLHRHVAIKVMNPALAATSPPRKRFLREARSAAAIKHENIVQVYGVEEHPLPYLVMEYVEGQTLKDKLDRSGPLDVAEILHLGRQMASGLAAAHAQGLIHRDIKPGNILIEAGPERKVKITDFGLARAADDASMTRSGVISGTPMYMAPEQAQGQALDHRSDLFSLGSVFYQIASGRPPFRGPTTIAVLKRVADESPRPIQEILPEVSDWLCAIIAKLQAKKPEDRFQSAQEVADLLARCQANLQQQGRVELRGDLVPFLPLPPSTTKAEQPVAEVAQNKPAATKEKLVQRRHRWAAAAAVLIALCAGLSLTEATGVTNVRGTVIRLMSPDGTLVVEVDDPHVSVSIDGEEMVILGAGAKEIRLKPGQYKVLASKDGKLVCQEIVTVTKNGRQVVRVSQEMEPASLVAGDKPIGSQPQSAEAPFDGKQATTYQEEWARYLNRKVVEENSVGMKMTLIPPGKFLQGSVATIEKDGQTEFKIDDSERPQHPVELTRPYFIANTEVAQVQFEKLMGRNPSAHAAEGNRHEAVAGVGTEKLPVEMVTWFDAVEFCNKLSAKEGLSPYYELQYPVRANNGTITVADVKQLGGLGYRLPTESEWEYACRAGTTTPYSFPFDYGTLGQYGWFGYIERPHPVGQRKPNPFGLCDMHGNVHEWCQDWFEPYSGEAEFDPAGPSKGPERVIRGGAYNYLPPYARSAWRGHLKPDRRHDNTGFRVARFISEAVKSPVVVANPSRRSAEWVLSVGGSMLVRVDNNVLRLKTGDELPRGNFEIAEVSFLHVQGLDDHTVENLKFMPKVTGKLWLHDTRNLGDVGLTKMASYPGFKTITSLTLNSTNVTDVGLATISNFTNLRSFELSSSEMSSKGLTALRPLKLENVALYECHNIGDEGLAEIARLESLQSLTLSWTPISDTGLESLAGCKSLQVLVVKKCAERGITMGRKPHTDAGLQQLAAARPDLRIERDGVVIEPGKGAGTDPDRRAAEYILSIPRDYGVRIQVNDVDRWISQASDLPPGAFRLTGVFVEWASKLDDGGLANFQGCRNVKILRLWGTQATENGLMHFKDCQDLHELSLNGDLINDSALEIFKGRKLNSLHVQSTKVTDAGLAHFQGSEILTKLAIAHSPVTDQAMSYFKDNKNLKHLSVVETKITDAGLAHFAGCDDLEVLELFGNRLSDAGLVHFQACKKLEKLDLGRLSLVTDTGLAHFQGCTNLDHLALSGTGVSDSGLVHLKNLTNLTFLRLDNTKVTDAGLAHLKPCQQVGELHLWQTRVTGTGFVHLKDLPNLSRLYLAECPVTDENIGALSECLKLRTLGLTKTRVSAAAVQKLAAALPLCQIEYVGGDLGPEKRQ